MGPVRTSLAVLLTVGGLAAQVYKLPFQCTEEDITSGGLGCTEDEPCPVFLELTAIESVGAQILAAGNLHTPSATLSTLLLASSDGGKTWREPVERFKGAALEQIRFFDFEYGWVTGQSLQPLPRDPFLLITTDGGKTWHRQAVFDEPRAGTIHAWWFDSRTSGSLVVDRGASSEGSRYELHETQTGGEGWMIREASDQPIRIKRMPAPADNPLRLRPDSAGKFYRVEKREGNKWTAVASLAIPLDPCKPPPAKEAEPPKEPETAPAVDIFVFPDPDAAKPRRKKR